MVLWFTTYFMSLSIHHLLTHWAVRPCGILLSSPYHLATSALMRFQLIREHVNLETGHNDISDDLDIIDDQALYADLNRNQNIMP
jgi:hypothetical protein